MKFIIFIILLFYSSFAHTELIKPNPNFNPIEVVSIQLEALKNNDTPYKNAGIEQTWEFAHPSNRKFTGPLDNFIIMMNSKAYSIMLNHNDHTIIPVENNDEISFFFVELIDQVGNKFGFQWTVKKVKINNEYIDCWMTIGVSAPMFLAKST